MAESLPRVAVLGIGTMGRGMADSLLRAGFTPALWNREADALIPFQGTEAQTFSTAAGAVHDADVVITMVTDANAVMDIADHHGMLEALPANAIWVQMSTIGVAGFERVAALATGRRADVLLVDAPVTGSRDAAEGGSLTIFASGPGSARTRLAPVFSALGSRTLWLGPAGNGTAMKLANNTMLAFVVQGLGEALGVAHHLNLTTTAVTDAFQSAAFGSPYVSHKLDRIEHGEFDAEFSLQLALKDVKLALDTVDPARHPALEAIATQWQEASDGGFGSEDLTAIVRVLIESS